MRRLKHHCKRLKTFGTTPEYLFRDQGVGGSNPLSPTISFQILAKSPGQRGLPKGLTFRVAGTGCAKNSRHTVAAALLTASTLSSSVSSGNSDPPNSGNSEPPSNSHKR